jgi:hypothetical protein
MPWRLGVSDIVSFDFQHLLPNTHFSIDFYFNQFAAMLAPARSGIRYLPRAFNRLAVGILLAPVVWQRYLTLLD